MTPTRRTAALVAAVVLSACGGGGSDQDVVPSPAPAPAPPEKTAPAAKGVLGQGSFDFGVPNRGGQVAPNSLHTPSGNIAIHNGTIFVPDTNNGRIVAYAPSPFAIGKPDLTSPFSGTPTRASTVAPTSVSVAGGRMAVVDTAANRVLVYSAIPSASGALPDFVLGQSNFTDGQSRGCFANGLKLPRSAVLTQEGKLIVSDTGNHRVLIWNSVTQSGQAADIVLGQGDFTHCTENDLDQDSRSDMLPTESTLNTPMGVWSDGSRLIVADALNSRVLIWDEMPTDGSENFKAANVVLGHASFTSGAANDTDGDGLDNDLPSATTLNSPMAVHSDGVRLAVGDSGNHRVLVWNRMPGVSGAAADQLFGQLEFNHKTENDTDHDGTPDAFPSRTVLNHPRGVLINGANLFVTDTDNHRVLIFQLAP